MIPEPPDDTWPLFFGEAAESHRATFPSRADDYGDNVRAKLEQAQTVERVAVEQARGVHIVPEGFLYDHSDPTAPVFLRQTNRT